MHSKSGKPEAHPEPTNQMSPQSGRLRPHISGHRQPPFSVESPDAPQIPGETKPRRNSKLAGKRDLLSVPNDRVQTVYDFVNWAAETFTDRRAFGTRAPLGGKNQQYTYTTYREYQTLVHKVGSGFRSLGLEKSDKVLIYAATRFVLFQRSCFKPATSQDADMHQVPNGWQLPTVPRPSRWSL